VKVLANENFPQAAVLALRGAGHDVLWARTEMPGASDEDVMARAAAEERMLVTFDTDSVSWCTAEGSRRRVASFSSDLPFLPPCLRRTAHWRSCRVARIGRGSSLSSRRRAFAFGPCQQALDPNGRNRSRKPRGSQHSRRA
jgi:hypothetical protein